MCFACISCWDFVKNLNFASNWGNYKTRSWCEVQHEEIKLWRNLINCFPLSHSDLQIGKTVNPSLEIKSQPHYEHKVNTVKYHTIHNITQILLCTVVLVPVVSWFHTTCVTVTIEPRVLCNIIYSSAGTHYTQHSTLNTQHSTLNTIISEKFPDGFLLS